MMGCLTPKAPDSKLPALSSSGVETNALIFVLCNHELLFHFVGGVERRIGFHKHERIDNFMRATAMHVS